MPAFSGEEMVHTLLQALPKNLAEKILEQLEPKSAKNLRAQLDDPFQDVNELALKESLNEFFDLLRILERGYLTVLNKPRTAEGSTTPTLPAEILEDPIAAIRQLPPTQLLRAIQDEQPSTVALILGTLDSESAKLIMKGLPNEIRGEVAVRYTQTGPRNHKLIEQIARALFAKAQLMSAEPEAPEPETRVEEMAILLRGLPRADRIQVLQRIEESDAELASKIRIRLYTFEDLLRLDDRALQSLLSQLNMKTLATALKGASPEINTKLSNNISSRAREMLNEEISLLSSVTNSQVRDAQAEILQLFRQMEEEGVITLEE